MRALGPALLAAVLTGCGDGFHYQAGRYYESRRRLPDALEHYEKYLAARPTDARAPELHVRVADMYARLQRCLEARRHYETTARDFPASGVWVSRAKAGIMNCPDYFPLSSGRSWVYGDSASGGKAMRLEWQARGDAIHGALFAGPRKLLETKTLYSVEDWAIWQSDAEGRGALLQYPYKPGRTWTVKRGKRELTYRIEADDARVKVAAGTFNGCLKVRETTKGFDSWRYDYYCPFVGRALTSVAGQGYENPNTELLRYSID